MTFYGKQKSCQAVKENTLYRRRPSGRVCETWATAVDLYTRRAALNNAPPTTSAGPTNASMRPWREPSILELAGTLGSEPSLLRLRSKTHLLFSSLTLHCGVAVQFFFIFPSFAGCRRCLDSTTPSTTHTQVTRPLLRPMAMSGFRGPVQISASEGGVCRCASYLMSQRQTKPYGAGTSGCRRAVRGSLRDQVLLFPLV